MTDDWELEDWFLDSYQEIIAKHESCLSSLTSAEQFFYEFACLDSEVKNGGASQYFANHGIERWRQLIEVWPANSVPAFGRIFEEFNAILAFEEDAYLAMLNASPKIEIIYDNHQAKVKRELRIWLAKNGR